MRRVWEFIRDPVINAIASTQQGPFLETALRSVRSTTPSGKNRAKTSLIWTKEITSPSQRCPCIRVKSLSPIVLVFREYRPKELSVSRTTMWLLYGALATQEG